MENFPININTVSRYFSMIININNSKPFKVCKGPYPKCGVFCQINILMDSESLPGSCNHKPNSKQTNNKKNRCHQSTYVSHFQRSTGILWGRALT